jgi:hypothetical protein
VISIWTLFVTLISPRSNWPEWRWYGRRVDGCEVKTLAGWSGRNEETPVSQQLARGPVVPSLGDENQ